MRLTARAGIEDKVVFNIAAHSQGGLIVYRAMDGLNFGIEREIDPETGRLKSETGTLLLSGAPVNAYNFYDVAEKSGFKIEGDEQKAFFQEHRPIDPITGAVQFDFVSGTLGRNYSNNIPENMSSKDAFDASIASIMHVGTNHTNYLCQGITCARGDQQQSVEVYRLGDQYNRLNATILLPRPREQSATGN